MKERLSKILQEKFNINSGHRLLIGCSGGLDSMVLLNLLHGLQFKVSVAHANYQLRGEDSEKDQQLVSDWCLMNGITFHYRRFDLGHIKGSIQLQARNQRYRWFQGLIGEFDYDYVLTAHHLNDSLETFLINLSRGTGIDGLTGIPWQNGKIIRPLNGFTREEILDYAKIENIKWREDLSNEDTKYLRNKIRHRVVPELQGLNLEFLQNFQKTLGLISASQALLEEYRKQLIDRLVEEKQGVKYISVEELKKLDGLKNHLHLMFAEFGFTQWDDMVSLLDAQSGKGILSHTHRLTKDRDQLLLTRLANIKDEVYWINEPIQNTHLPIGLKIEEVHFLGESHKNCVFVDKEKLNYPLWLRKWRNGDYFYPYGMQGKKKVAKFFKDSKLNAIQKERTWILGSEDGIVWIIGHRLDDRFKVTGHTKKILRLSC